MDRIIATWTIALLALAGCSAMRSKSDCTFELDAREWHRVARDKSKPFAAYLSDGSTQWYRNDAGDYLICLNARGGHKCGGNYAHHVLQPDGAYKEEAFVVCTS